MLDHRIEKEKSINDQEQITLCRKKVNGNIIYIYVCMYVYRGVIHISTTSLDHKTNLTIDIHSVTLRIHLYKMNEISYIQQINK